jgi:hypothetical protein
MKGAKQQGRTFPQNTLINAYQMSEFMRKAYPAKGSSLQNVFVFITVQLFLQKQYNAILDENVLLLKLNKKSFQFGLLVIFFFFTFPTKFSLLFHFPFFFCVLHHLGKPVSWIMMAPSVTPRKMNIGSNNPAMRLYKFDTDTGQVGELCICIQ